MEDTDWRPSKCPSCGAWREAARNPVCTNPDCGENQATRIRELEAENNALRDERDAARAAVNRLGRAMGVVPGVAQCFGDVIDEAIKRLSALAETEGE